MSSVLPKGPLERHPSLFCLLTGTQRFLGVQSNTGSRKKGGEKKGKKSLPVQLPFESIFGISTTGVCNSAVTGVCANEQRIVRTAELSDSTVGSASK